MQKSASLAKFAECAINVNLRMLLIVWGLGVLEAGEFKEICCVCRQFFLTLRNRVAKLARFAVFASPTLFYIKVR